MKPVTELIAKVSCQLKTLSIYNVGEQDMAITACWRELFVSYLDNLLNYRPRTAVHLAALKNMQELSWELKKELERYGMTVELSKGGWANKVAAVKY